MCLDHQTSSPEKIQRECKAQQALLHVISVSCLEYSNALAEQNTNGLGGIHRGGARTLKPHCKNGKAFWLNEVYP